MCGYCLLKLLRFLGKRLSFPFELIARARYPSSLTSYTHSGAVRELGNGEAFHRLDERRFACRQRSYFSHRESAISREWPG
jgi:hypothetical protein